MGESLALYVRTEVNELNRIALSVQSRLWLDVVERWALSTGTGQRWVADVCAGVKKLPIQGELFPDKETE